MKNNQSPFKGGAVLYGQSGGTTRVINASGYGVIENALKHKDISNVLWAGNGVKGILNEELFDMRKEDPEELRLLMQTPGAAYGSCRKKIKTEEELDKVIEVFKKYNVRYFFYNGGNDSMDTCHKVSEHAKKVGYELRVMGIPKTIDNDLAATDHTPGYGSAAKYIALACRDLKRGYAGIYGDSEPITIVETMGRNAGWLAGASALAAEEPGIENIPLHIYLPEVPFKMDKFVEDTIKHKKVIVVVSEGVKNEQGVMMTEAAQQNVKRDEFGHVKTGGLATYLADELRKHTKIRVKSVELGPLQLCQSAVASKTDVEEAYNAGKLAFESAVGGMTGRAVSFKCTRAPEYKCEFVTVPLGDVANYEQKIPLEWIDTENNYVKQEFIDHIRPLVGGNPEVVYDDDGFHRHAKLKRIKYKI